MSDIDYGDNLVPMYIDGIYFVTTTMTAVGYGDFSAYGKGYVSMGTVMITQFFGLLGFSIVKQQVFATKYLTTIDDVVQDTVLDIEHTLY